jgi:hypothetical protein
MLFVKDKTGKYGFYGSMPEVMRDYPDLKWDTVMYYLSRKKKPYITPEIEIYKGEVARSSRK